MKPDKPIVRRYLGDEAYPVKQQELVPVAESNSAPVAFVERLRNLPKDVEFSNLGEDNGQEILERYRSLLLALKRRDEEAVQPGGVPRAGVAGP